MKNIHIPFANFDIGQNLPFTLIAGPCAMESRDHALFMAEELKNICQSLNINLIYKSSFDKANRTSLHAKRGMGIDKAMRVFEEIKQQFSLPVITDVHESYQCEIVADVVDVLQIPAFLCRQTDLLLAAAKTKKVVNIKKAQFLSAYDMQHVVQKLEQSGYHDILLCERGTSFGYNTLVSDMRSLPIMAQSGYPVIFDVTHSVQMPGGLNGASGGQREFTPILARAALAIGVAGLFIETHDNPNEAFSDGANMIPLKYMKNLLKQFMELDAWTKENPVFNDFTM